MNVGIWQLLLIILIILLLFGTGRLSGIMGDFAKGLKEMKDTLGNNKGKKTEEARAKESKEEEGDKIN